MRKPQFPYLLEFRARIGLSVFLYLRVQDLDFHLTFGTVDLSRDVELSTNDICFLLRFTVFSTLQALLEIGQLPPRCFRRRGLRSSPGG